MLQALLTARITRNVIRAIEYKSKQGYSVYTVDYDLQFSKNCALRLSPEP